MKITIRMDDITPDMNWENFNRFKALLDQYGIKPLIGVVPDNQDENLAIDKPHQNFWEQVKEWQASGWVVAQHGVDHVYKTKKMGVFPLNQLSEFAGLSYDQQYTALKRGKELLKEKGIETDMFMAPAHSYDKNTLKALKACGFKKITDGFGNRPYNWQGLTFYPISFKQSKSLNTKAGFTTFVLHANTMNEDDFVKYESLFKTHKDDFISYGVFLQEKPVRKNAFGKLKETVMAYTKFVLVQKL